jgi:hypothetical protein
MSRKECVMATSGLTYALAALVGTGCLIQPLSAEPTGTRAGASTTTSIPAGPLSAGQCASPTADNAAACEGLFATMMEYQKMANKEAREDRRLQRDDRRSELNATAGKIKTDNAAIDQQMQEAREKADTAQQSAATQSATGVIGGTLQAASGRESAATSAILCRDPKAECNEPCKLPPCE